MNLVLIIVVTFVVGSLSVGGAYLLWLKSRPYKETWRAKVYKLAEGIHSPVDKTGKVISELKLKDLNPYFTDIAEKISKAPGITIYRLQRLNKAIPAITSDVVERWGEIREVNLIEIKGSFYLLKKGFNEAAGQAIFSPLPIDDLNMVESEMAVRDNRYNSDKHILEAISPWVVTALLCLTLISGIYIITESFTVQSENFAESAIVLSKSLDRVTQATHGVTSAKKTEVVKPTPQIKDVPLLEES